MKKEYEFEKMQERQNNHDPNANKLQISLRLDGELISLIKEEADRLGLPYQTLIQSILHQYIHGELISAKELQLLKKALAG